MVFKGMHFSLHMYVSSLVCRFADAVCIGIIVDAGGDDGAKQDQLQDVDGDKA